MRRILWWLWAVTHHVCPKHGHAYVRTESYGGGGYDPCPGCERVSEVKTALKKEAYQRKVGRFRAFKLGLK